MNLAGHSGGLDEQWEARQRRKDEKRGKGTTSAGRRVRVEGKQRKETTQETVGTTVGVLPLG